MGRTKKMLCSFRPHFPRRNIKEERVQGYSRWQTVVVWDYSCAAGRGCCCCLVAWEVREKKWGHSCAKARGDLREKHGHHKVPVQNILHIYIKYIHIWMWNKVQGRKFHIVSTFLHSCLPLIHVIYDITTRWWSPDAFIKHYNIINASAVKWDCVWSRI